MFDRFFNLSDLGTSVKSEVLAGLTTFLTMAYIIFANPAILSAAGFPFAGVLFATVLVASISSIAMGLYAKLPFALAPGMGLNAFVAYTVVLGMGYTWQQALAAVFVSGLIFIVLSLPKINIREKIVDAVPRALRSGVAAGIGLFLAFIGLVNAGVVVGDPATLVAFGGFSVSFGLFLFGFVLAAVLLAKKIKGALLVSIVATSVLAALTSATGLAPDLVAMPEAIFALPAFSTVFALDFSFLFTPAIFTVLFAMLFTDMFDSISTFMGLSEVAGFVESDGKPKNVGKALLVDGVSTTISGLLGSSAGTAYIESASGIEEGGKSGLTAVVAGLLFLPFMFLSPLVGLVPAVAVAPVLVLVGLFMLKGALNINWADYSESIPAFIAMIAVPFMYSITQGIVLGFISYVLIKIATGKVQDISITLWIIFVLSVLSLFVI